MNAADRLRDWLDHARGNRRRAHEYKRWAKEAEAEGNLSTYRHWRKQSDKSWRAAWKALQEARLNKELLNV
jgi:hypothetical protein